MMRRPGAERISALEYQLAEAERTIAELRSDLELMKTNASHYRAELDEAKRVAVESLGLLEMIREAWFCCKACTGHWICVNPSKRTAQQNKRIGVAGQKKYAALKQASGIKEG